jgi:hypothetical protein
VNKFYELQISSKVILLQYRQLQKNLFDARLQIETTLLAKDQSVPKLQFKLLLKRKLENVLKRSLCLKLVMTITTTALTTSMSPYI